MSVHGFLIVDKPRGLSSHDVVARVRRLLSTRKVGHAGTLDPAAEGVLVVAVGRATKLLSTLSISTKRYAAHVVLGANSLTGDIEGPVQLVHESVMRPSTDAVNRALSHFVGELDQVPPAYAAIKVDGQPLYQRARRGETVEVPSRRIIVSKLNILEYRYPDLYIDVECSAGTYIRSLARDIGVALNTGAYLHYLLRTRSGHFDLGQAWPLDELERNLNSSTFAMFARHPSSVDDDSIAVLLDSNAASAWYDGRPVPADYGERTASGVHAFRDDGSWVGVGTYDTDQNAYHPRIVVHE